ncbi:MAG: nucleotide exchange factor GrpE [Pirellulales bacterium]
MTQFNDPSRQTEIANDAPPAADTAQSAPGPTPWPQLGQVLTQLGQWLDETGGEVAAGDDSLSDALDAVAVSQMDLSVVSYPLLEKLSSLRHEVKLLTKAARCSEERTEATLLAMQAAIEQFQSLQTSQAEAAQTVQRPLVETLIDMDESLLRGRRAIENARHQILDELDRGLRQRQQQFETLYRAQPWWRRWLCRPWHAAATDLVCGQLLAEHRQALNSLLEGYDLICSRLRRTMDQQSIVRMECLGRTVDPHSMKVLEIVTDPARPAGQVVEEVRPGYHWRGQTFRYAEVRATSER